MILSIGLNIHHLYRKYKLLSKVKITGHKVWINKKAYRICAVVKVYVDAIF
jgi:hypothetical protein